MIKRNLLEGLNIVDLGHRLPGPYGTYLLSNLGARVIKIEDQKFKDPFIEGLFPQIDSSFAVWYQQFNQRKEIIRLDFQAPDAAQRVSEILSKADGLILGLPPKLKTQLGLNEEDLAKRQQALGVVELLASFSHKEKMHDLNALALSGVLELHTHRQDAQVLAPPFLPLAGLGLGIKGVLDLLACILKARQDAAPVLTKTFLLETTQELFDPFWPKELRTQRKTFLHNGRYPCYALYRTKDHQYVALAAVEEKLWKRFGEIFKLELSPQERFHCQDQRVFELLAKLFQGLNSSQIEELTSEEDFCLTLVHSSPK